MREPVILLTACINPNGMAYTVLQDSDERLRQYRMALNWYLQHVNNKIVFVENTGYDISPSFKDVITSGRLEVLTFQGNDYEKARGKGYGEALIIEYALENSKYLKDNVNVIKITGRLICENVGKIAKRYVDTETVYGLKMLDPDGNMEMSSQVIVASVRFWKEYFIPQKESINDDVHYWFEHLLLDAVAQWKNDDHKFKNMWFPLALKGISGSTGIEIKNSFMKETLSFYAHYILNHLGYYGAVIPK